MCLTGPRQLALWCASLVNAKHHACLQISITPQHDYADAMAAQTLAELEELRAAAMEVATEAEAAAEASAAVPEDCMQLPHAFAHIAHTHTHALIHP